MKYYYNLYLDDYVASNKNEIIEKLENSAILYKTSVLRSGFFA